MANEITIPLLPCHAINPMLEFYQALGFEVTYQQTRPNNYAVVVRGGIELHFFSMKDYVPANSYSTCYVRVEEIDALYGDFAQGLKTKYGRVPSAGIPRVIPLKAKSGRREFIVVDPGGNWIRIGQPTSKEEGDEAELPKADASKMERILHSVSWLADSKGDYAAAAKMLDNALSTQQRVSAIDRYTALVYRAGIAITMEETETAREMLKQAADVALTVEERKAVQAQAETAMGFAKQLPE